MPTLLPAVTYTRQFTRSELIEHVQRIADNAEKGQQFVYADAMKAVVAVLENYPLANVASEAVRILFKDINQRRGFRELLESMPREDVLMMQGTLKDAISNAVVYREPAQPKAEELDFTEDELA